MQHVSAWLASYPGSPIFPMYVSLIVAHTIEGATEHT